MHKKVDFFLDESYTYSIANSKYDMLFLPDKCNHFTPYFDCWNKWVPSELFKGYLTTDEENSFNYSNLWQNIEQDTHPPLYYIIIHTICSFFPETFSKWYGFIPNLFFFILTQILIYAICSKLSNKRFALIACTIFGFSAAAVNNYIYIRMYSMLTVFFLLLLYQYLICLDFKNNTPRIASVFIIILLGSLTHYHFLPYAFFITLTMICICAKEKQTDSFWKISISALLSVITAYLVFPSVVSQIAVSPRATEASSFLSKTIPFFGGSAFSLENILGIPFNHSLTVTGIAIIAYFIFSFNAVIKNSKLKYNSNSIYLIVIPTFLFIFLISITIDFFFLGRQSLRFFYPIFPFITIIISIFLEKFYPKNWLIICFIILSLYSHYSNTQVFAFTAKQQYSNLPPIEKILENKNLICFGFYPEMAQACCPKFLFSKNIFLLNNDNFQIQNLTKYTIQPDLLICPQKFGLSFDYKKIGTYKISLIDYDVYDMYIQETSANKKNSTNEGNPK